MMNCEECSEKLTFIIFGEPIPQEMDILEHIAECDTCREEYIQLLKVESTLSESMSELPSANLTLGNDRKKSVIAEASKIDGEMKRDFQSSTFKQFPVFITTLAACIVISFLWYNKKGEPGKSSQNVVMEKSAESNTRRKSNSIADEVVEEELADADDPAEKTGKLERLENSAPKKKALRAKSFKAKAEEEAFANELKKEVSKDALALEEKKSDTKSEKKLILQEAKIKEESLAVADKASVASPEALGRRAESNTKAMVEKWLTANKDDKAVQTTAAYLKAWGYDNITLSPVKIKDENTLKIILQKKNEKPIDYGFFFIHNGEIIRFKPMTEVEIK